jgi:hypothetical protein
MKFFFTLTLAALITVIPQTSFSKIKESIGQVTYNDSELYVTINKEIAGSNVTEFTANCAIKVEQYKTSVLEVASLAGIPLSDITINSDVDVIQESERDYDPEYTEPHYNVTSWLVCDAVIRINNSKYTIQRKESVLSRIPRKSFDKYCDAFEVKVKNTIPFLLRSKKQRGENFFYMPNRVCTISTAEIILL